MATSAMEDVASFLLYRAPEIRRTLLRALVFGVPVFFLRFTNDPFTLPKLSLLIALAGAVAGLRLAEMAIGRGFRVSVVIFVPVAAAGVPLLVAWIFGPYKYWSLLGEYGRFQGLVPYLLLGAFAVLAAEAFTGRIRDLAWPLVAGGAVAGGYALIQFIGIDPLAWAQQFGGAATQTSTIGNPNFYGGFLAIVLPVAIALWVTEEERPMHALVSGVLVLGGLIVSFSQGAWGAGIAGSIVVGSFYVRDRLGWAPLAAGALVLLLMVGGIARVAREMVRVDFDSTSTEQLRALWWDNALNMAKESPLVGRGPNAYAVEGPQYRSPADAQAMGFDTANDPHSVPLFFLTSAGVLGLLGYFVLLGWVFLRGRWLATAGIDEFLGAGMLAGAAAYFVQSVVAIDELTVRFALWACVAGLAAVGRPVAEEPAITTGMQGKKKFKGKSTPTTLRIQRPIFVAAGVVVLLIGAWFGLRLTANDAHLRSASAAAAQGRVDEAREAFQEVISSRGDYRYRHLQGFHLGQLALALEREERDGSELLAEALAAFSYVEDFPSVPATTDRSRLLRSYAEFDRSLRDEAAESYGSALALDPLNSTLVSEAATAMWFARDWEALVNQVAPAVERSLQPLGVDAYLAAAYAHLGDEEAARAALDRLDAAQLETEPALEALELLEEGS